MYQSFSLYLLLLVPYWVNISQSKSHEIVFCLIFKKLLFCFTFHQDNIILPQIFFFLWLLYLTSLSELFPFLNLHNGMHYFYYLYYILPWILCISLPFFSISSPYSIHQIIQILPGLLTKFWSWCLLSNSKTGLFLSTPVLPSWSESVTSHLKCCNSPSLVTHHQSTPV